MSPLLLTPVLKRARWGGRRLGTLFGKALGSESDYAESWELVDRGPVQSCVAAGPCQDRTLHSLMEAHSEDLLGPRAAASRFPLLVKLIDAADRLSVQVHPTCAQAAAMQLTEPGKSEAWVIMEADPGSRLYVGLKRGVTEARLRDALRAGDVESCLHSFPARVGDCINVPAGTVHAIGEGIVLTEVQQPSDLTFRLFDWGRVERDGSPRPLHIEQAFQCIDFERGPMDPVSPVTVEDAGHPCELLLTSPNFVLRRHIASDRILIPDDGRFHVLLMLAGAAEIRTDTETIAMPRGSTVLLPARRTAGTIHPQGRSTILDVFLPDSGESVRKS
jgi:mannose-6-phosphate isomerase